MGVDVFLIGVKVESLLKKGKGSHGSVKNTALRAILHAILILFRVEFNQIFLFANLAFIFSIIFVYILASLIISSSFLNENFLGDDLKRTLHILLGASISCLLVVEKT